MKLSASDRLALIREYKAQGGKGHYLSVIKEYEKGGNVETWGNTGYTKERKFLQPNDPHLPRALHFKDNNPWMPQYSSELATSIGGENGEPAYLIPSFKYGAPLTNPLEEFRKTGEYLGGPFKTYQEADEWDRNIRHPYVEKNQAIPSPISTRSYERGGEIQQSIPYEAPTNEQVWQSTIPKQPVVQPKFFTQPDLNTLQKTDLPRNIHTNRPVITPREEYEQQQSDKRNQSEISNYIKAQQQYTKEHSDIYTDPQTGKKVIQNIGIQPTASPIDAAVLGVGAIYSGGIGLLGNMAEFVNPLPINPLKAGKGLKNFKSEINWSKWNKEIPENSQLMKEYNTIEQTSKANGTWMKNSDGSLFQGTPEQFIQQNSQNFKIAFPKGSGISYRGDLSKILELKSQQELGKEAIRRKYNLSNEDTEVLEKLWERSKDKLNSGKYTTDDYNAALKYAGGNKDNVLSLYTDIRNPKITEPGESFRVLENDRKKLLSEGYDALITKSSSFYPEGENVLLKNNQIKSAIGNNGMFDMTNPNIYKALLPIGLGGTQMYKYKKKYK